MFQITVIFRPGGPFWDLRGFGASNQSLTYSMLPEKKFYISVPSLEEICPVVFRFI